VSYRLDRIRELTGLDPSRSEDRERLGLGLKAYRIIKPRLHR
jgi:sugar diacid utilization regulator